MSLKNLDHSFSVKNTSFLASELGVQSSGYIISCTRSANMNLKLLISPMMFDKKWWESSYGDSQCPVRWETPKNLVSET